MKRNAFAQIKLVWDMRKEIIDGLPKNFGYYKIA